MNSHKDKMIVGASFYMQTIWYQRKEGLPKTTSYAHLSAISVVNSEHAVSLKKCSIKVISSLRRFVIVQQDEKRKQICTTTQCLF
jgi:hypothetical protein